MRSMQDPSRKRSCNLDNWCNKSLHSGKWFVPKVVAPFPWQTTKRPGTRKLHSLRKRFLRRRRCYLMFLWRKLLFLGVKVMVGGRKGGLWVRRLVGSRELVCVCRSYRAIGGPLVICRRIVDLTIGWRRLGGPPCPLV